MLASKASGDGESANDVAPLVTVLDEAPPGPRFYITPKTWHKGYTSFLWASVYVERRSKVHLRTKTIA